MRRGGGLIALALALLALCLGILLGVRPDGAAGLLALPRPASPSGAGALALVSSAAFVALVVVLGFSFGLALALRRAGAEGSDPDAPRGEDPF